MRTFWATEKAWARTTAESRMFVWRNDDSNEEEKGNWDSNQISVVVSDVFEYFILKNGTYPWVCFFLRPIWHGNINFMQAAL